MPERGVVDARQHRPETGVVLGLGGRQRNGAVGAAVEGAQEGDQVLAPGGEAGQLDGALDRLGAGVAQEDPALLLHRRDAGQLGARLGVDREVEVGAVVDQLAGLLLDRAHDVGVAVAGGGHGDAGVEVEEQVAVDVLDHAALGPNRHHRVRARHARRRPLLVELEVGARLGAGQLGDDVRDGWPERAKTRCTSTCGGRDGTVAALTGWRLCSLDSAAQYSRAPRNARAIDPGGPSRALA